MKATLIILSIIAGFGGPFEKKYDYKDITECRIALNGLQMQERPEGGAFLAFCQEKP